MACFQINIRREWNGKGKTLLVDGGNVEEALRAALRAVRASKLAKASRKKGK